MRGSLELSLNALVMFIVSIIVLGFGIWLVGVFIGAGVQVIQVPDWCEPELRGEELRGRTFAICPGAIRQEEWIPYQWYVIGYVITGVEPGQKSYYVNVSDSRYQALPSSVFNVSRGESRRGTVSIRLAPDEDVPTSIERIQLRACEIESDTADIELLDECAEPLATRMVTINS